MANSPMNDVVRHLQCAVRPDSETDLSDGELLGRFLERRDHTACAALVRRLGPLVWGVCRRIVSHEQDAEDAFQATFLVLVRKAASVRPRDMVGHWLYGVARQTALKARSMAARRRTRERQVTHMPEGGHILPAADGNALEPALDRELASLPERYRAVLVLCDLGGKTRSEAARQLGVPEGTVAGRLARARALLARRLKQRGALPAAGLATLLTAGAVPARVLSVTIEAVTKVAAGETLIAATSATTAELSEGVLRAMLQSKLIKSAIVLLGLVAVGGGLLAYHTAAVQGDETAAIAPQVQATEPAPDKVAGQVQETAPKQPSGGGTAQPGIGLGEQPKKQMQMGKEAAKWLADAGDGFALSLYGCRDTIVFMRDKTKYPKGTSALLFEISEKDAASIVQSLVNSGLWGRHDTPIPGPPAPGRYLSVGTVPVTAPGYFWRLGLPEDDITPMYVVQHLLKVLDKKPAITLRDWLVPVVKATPPKIPEVPIKPAPGIGEAREIQMLGFKADAAIPKGGFLKPIEIRDGQSLDKLVLKNVTQEMAKKIPSQVDLNKEYLLLFAWKGSGGDKLSFKVEAGKDGSRVSFTYHPGPDPDFRSHFRLFALPTNASWVASGM